MGDRREEERQRPRVRPQMNTGVRRHEERSLHRRKSKYREDPLMDEDYLDRDLDDDKGVLSDYEDDEDDDDPDNETSRGGR